MTSRERSGAPARPAPPSREVPWAHALLALVVVALGLLMVVQSLAPPRTRVDLASPADDVAETVAAGPVASVADALLLRAAFSVVPELQELPEVVAGGQGASVTTGLFGSSALRPSGLLLPSPASSTRPVGVSGVLWAAYEMAARRVSASCRLQPSLLAAIGEVESGSLAGRRLDPEHNVVPPVLGPRLAGGGVAAIRDTDDGRLDGDRTWDRAVGPMQFIPGTWRAWGSDGNGDGVANPQNVEDAVLSAARYLCAGGRDLSDAADLRAAILSYNHSMSYLARVLELMSTIEPGTLPRLGVAPVRTAVGSTSTTPHAVPLAPTGPTSTPASTVPTSPTTGAEPGTTESSSPPAPVSSSTTPTSTSPTTSSSPSSTAASAASSTAAEGTDVSSTGDLQGGGGQPTTSSASAG